MEALGYALFDTPLGHCGLAWSERGVVCLHLPERDESSTRAYLRGRFAQAAELVPEGAVAEAVQRVRGLLRGARDDLQSVAVDLSAQPPFARRVYVAARGIGVGHTSTYGEIARQLGAPGAARAVGQALGQNPVAIIVPCHRVLAAGGRIGGFSAHGGLVTKRNLLAIELAACSSQLSLGLGSGASDAD